MIVFLPALSIISWIYYKTNEYLWSWVSGTVSDSWYVQFFPKTKLKEPRRLTEQLSPWTAPDHAETPCAAGVSATAPEILDWTFSIFTQGKTNRLKICVGVLVFDVGLLK